MSLVPFNPGDILLGKYRMDRLLGMGAMGVVVAATHLGLNQPVAIKFMLANMASTREQQERFLREARAAVQLQTQHVARVTDVGTTEHGAPYLVMELLNGQDLDAILRERGPLPYAEAVDYLLQACEAVAEAHHLGIVHRDLKPANLFLATVAGLPCVKVLDFGVAKVMNAAKLTTERASLGSPYYMSPEQMRDGGSVDTRSDIWALGVVLYQLVTGQFPFDSDSIPGLCAQVFMKDPVPFNMYRTDAPPGFEAVLLRCLEKDRELRIQSVLEFANAIVAFGSPASAVYPTRIAAAGGARGLLPSSSSSGLHPAPTQSKGTTTGSPIVALGSSTTSVPRPQSSAAMAAAVVLSVLSLGGAGAMYFRARHLASSTSATTSTPTNASVEGTPASAEVPEATPSLPLGGASVTVSFAPTPSPVASASVAASVLAAPPASAPPHRSPLAPREPRKLTEPIRPSIPDVLSR